MLDESYVLRKCERELRRGCNYVNNACNSNHITTYIKGKRRPLKQCAFARRVMRIAQPLQTKHLIKKSTLSRKRNELLKGVINK